MATYILDSKHCSIANISFLPSLFVFRLVSLKDSHFCITFAFASPCGISPRRMRRLRKHPQTRVLRAQQCYSVLHVGSVHTVCVSLFFFLFPNVCIPLNVSHRLWLWKDCNTKQVLIVSDQANIHLGIRAPRASSSAFLLINANQAEQLNLHILLSQQNTHRIEKKKNIPSLFIKKTPLF